ncbi:nuclear transport factor 2 family protein [Streptomyces sp. NPDC089919]|uniref:nuclear transport factor 2 family protein n=1 Tax=Streptomyces sp. NPDC089919 TaxID=3155188 RepID=UPI003426BDE4
MHAFRKMVESGDLSGLEALLAEDVVFTSPVAFSPYRGRAITAAIVRGASRVFEDFSYQREFDETDGRGHALVFDATVGGKRIQGCDFLHFDESGLIDGLTVMVRPLSAANALAEAMGAQFDRITQEATGN